MKVNEYYRPSSLKEAYGKLIEHPQNVLLGGGLWIKKTDAPVNVMIDLEPLGLKGITVAEKEISIGALQNFYDLEKHPAIFALGGGFLSKALKSVMGVALRRQATIGGTLAGKYPFSDIITALLTLEVELDFYPEKTLRLEEYLAQKGKLKEILTTIRIKKGDSRGYFHKVSNTPLDFALLNIAINHADQRYKIAIGSRPGISQLAEKTMAFVNGSHSLDEDTIAKAADILISEISFASTTSGSGEYRAALAKTYLKRGLAEVTNHVR